MGVPSVVPRNAEFYVRGALQRALHATLENITMARQSADEIERGESEAPQMFANQLRGMAKYEQQWLAEAVEAFAELPEEVRPDLKKFAGIKPFGPLITENMTAEEIDKEIAALQLVRATLSKGGKS